MAVSREVTSPDNTLGTAELMTSEPHVEGYVLGSTKLKDDFTLVAEEESLILDNNIEGVI